MKLFKHLKTVIIHKYWVFYFSRKLGIWWQGFWHDMSKFSPTELLESVKYYTGTRSPIDACKEDKGYSLAWLHHKGRNPHHYEFWQDNFDKGTTHLDMPDKYVKEMICDYFAAGRTYNGKNYTFDDQWTWWNNKTRNPIAMNDRQQSTLTRVFREMHELYGNCTIDELEKYDWEYFLGLVETSIEMYHC